MSDETKIIARNLRTVRDTAHLTTGQVAYRAGVAERTLQRAEAGESVREENLQAICQCLGVTTEIIRIDFDNPPEHLVQAMARAATLQPLKAHRVLAALDVDALNGQFSIFHRDEHLSEEAQDLAVAIQQNIQDMIDIFSDGEHTERWEESKRIAILLEELDRAGAAMMVGTETVHLKATAHAPKPMPVTLMICSYQPNTNLPPSLIYDRRSLPGVMVEHVPA